MESVVLMEVQPSLSEVREPASTAPLATLPSRR